MWSDIFQVVFLSALPVTELRAALPLALTVYQLPTLVALIAVFVGNSVPIFVLFFVLPPLLKVAEEHIPWLHRLFERYFRYLKNKHQHSYDRYGAWMLALFVAIPLPGTGVWTGALLAILFDMERKRAIAANMVGMVVAGLIVWFLTVFGIHLFGL